MKIKNKTTSFDEAKKHVISLIENGLISQIALKRLTYGHIQESILPNIKILDIDKIVNQIVF